MEERKKSENIKLVFRILYPTCFSGRIGWLVPKELLLKVGGEDLSGSLEMGAEKTGQARAEGLLQSRG